MDKLDLLKIFLKTRIVKFLGSQSLEKLREKVCKRYKVENRYSSHKELEKDISKYDGVVIVTKRNMMPAITYELLKYGKPILTEKPMAMSLVQSSKLLSRSKKNMYVV